MGAFMLRAAGRSVLILALTLAAASPLRAQTPDPSYATQAFTPQGFRLPEGQGCSADVARWQAIQDNDYRGGNIGLPVYRRIHQEIAQAAAACQAGHDAQASALVRASRARHGYPQ
jgi:hypothetical protein